MSATIIQFPKAYSPKHEAPNLDALSPAQKMAVKSLRRTALLMRDGAAKAGSFMETLSRAIGEPRFAQSAAKLREELSMVEPPCDVEPSGAA